MEFLIKFFSLCWVLCRYESSLWECVEYHWWMWWGLSWRYSIWLKSILEQDDKTRWCWRTSRKHLRFYNLLIFYVKSIFDRFKNLHRLQRIKFLFGVKSVFFMNTIFQLDTYLSLFFVLDLVLVDWMRFDPLVISDLFVHFSGAF